MSFYFWKQAFKSANHANLGLVIFEASFRKRNPKEFLKKPLVVCRNVRFEMSNIKLLCCIGERLLNCALILQIKSDMERAHLNIYSCANKHSSYICIVYRGNFVCVVCIPSVILSNESLKQNRCLLMFIRQLIVLHFWPAKYTKCLYTECIIGQDIHGPLPQSSPANPSQSSWVCQIPKI